MKNKVNIEAFFLGVMVMVFVAFTVLYCTEDKKINQVESYKIEVIDKYDKLGSTWHLIGGRATEQEYHVIYKVTPLNDACTWPNSFTRDTEVTYLKYKNINIGDTREGKHTFINMYY